MFLRINRNITQSILVTANEGRGTLMEARIVFIHLTSHREITITKPNVSTHRARYDEFVITAGDLALLEEGDFIYTVYATTDITNLGLDPDSSLEAGRGRVSTTFVTTEVVYDRSTTDVIYERA